MDNFVAGNGLTNSFTYLDDIITGGLTKEEHDENLAAFKKGCGLLYGL